MSNKKKKTIAFNKERWYNAYMFNNIIKEKGYIMKINKISLKGFRNVDMTILDLDELVALVSTNNYGKSNVLAGIKFGIDFINASEKGKEIMMKWIKGIPLNKQLDSENYQLEIELATEIKEKTYIIQYGFEFKWYRNDGTGQKIIGEYLKLKKEEDKRFTLYINRNEKESLFKSSETGRCNTKININQNELIINKLKAFDNLFYIDIINRLNSIKFYVERHLDASTSYEADPVIRVDVDEFDLNNTNFPRMIYVLKNEYNDKYELLINSFMQLFPTITQIQIKKLAIKYDKKIIPDNIPFRISDELYRIMVFDKNLNQPINFDSMSDGAKRIFLQLATIIIAEIQGYSVIAIEEPENSIQPILFQSYLRIISQFKGECKIIITSHSPYLLRYLRSDRIYVGIPNNEGKAKFSHIKKSNVKQLNKFSDQFNISIGDYIFELMNGSEEDIKQLKDFLEVKDE